MASEVQICNMALRVLGVGRISSLTENRQEARDCNLFFDTARDTVLKSRQWTFAQKRRSLTSIDMPTDYEGKYLYAYVYPNDCLKPHRVYSPASTKAQKHEVFRLPTGEKVLFTDVDEAILHYTVQVTDPTWFTPEFDLTMSFYLASLLAWPLLKNSKLAELMLMRFRESLASAQVSNVQEQDPKKEESVPWIDARTNTSTDESLYGGYYYDNSNLYYTEED